MPKKKSINFHYLANPKRFQKYVQRLLPFNITAMLIFLVTGLYYALFSSPPDYQQSEIVRIMYIHVPSAWMALMIYMIMACHAFISLVWKHPIADIIVKSCAPIGLLFTVICLITGSIWGKPMWGAWWVWDARLTSVLLLLFLYLGILLLYRSFDRQDSGDKIVNILVLFGSLNIPIIKWSVNWWNTLHQPASITKLSSPSIHIDMLIPLMLMASAFFFYFLTLFSLKVKSEIYKRKSLIYKEKSYD